MSMEKLRGFLKDWLEFGLAWIVLKALGLLPFGTAQRVGEWTGSAMYFAWPNLRRVGMRNLELSFPSHNPMQRITILRQAYRNLGRQLGEFSHFPKLNDQRIREIVEYEGLEHYLEARRAGRGVIILTGHVGSWELSSYAHSLYGYPMLFLSRPLDNRRVESLIDRYRTGGGNHAIPKSDSVRRLAAALKRGETIGILMDLNMQQHEGVFCDFFGIPACTTPIIAALATRFYAAVLPGFLIWQPARRRHLLKFYPPVPLIQTQAPDSDLMKNIALYNTILEQHIRSFPDQWFWVHKRWHTRPPGAPSLYG